MFFSRFFSSAMTTRQSQKILDDWEYATCKGSEHLNQDDFKTAIEYFEAALTYSKLGLKSPFWQGIFMQYYSLASMNLAHALMAYEKQRQSEKVLSDAHFHMLALMIDKKQSKSFRYEAKKQAELLLTSLKKFLINIDKIQVAESLEEEFYRLKLVSSYR